MLVQFESFIYGEDKYRGEVEIPLEVEASVIAEKDPYATGDSPTMYHVELKSVIVRDPENYYIASDCPGTDGQEIVDLLDSYNREAIEEEAIKEVA
jgi:hypothetical protein